MKALIRFASVFTVLVALFGAGVGTSGAAPPVPAASAASDNGAYVILGKPPTSQGLDFRYGWRSTSKFSGPAVGYWLGLYDVTNSHYVWSGDNAFDPVLAPGAATMNAVEFHYSDPASSLPPGEYALNFFVRSDYGTSPPTNTATVTLLFSVP